MPARSACRNSSEESSGAIRMAPISGRSAMSFSAAASPSGDGARRAEHGHERDAGEPLAQQLDAGDGHGEVAELHGQAIADRLVRVDDCDGGAQTPDQPGHGACSRVQVRLHR